MANLYVVFVGFDSLKATPHLPVPEEIAIAVTFTKQDTARRQR